MAAHDYEEATDVGRAKNENSSDDALERCRCRCSGARDADSSPGWLARRLPSCGTLVPEGARCDDDDNDKHDHPGDRVPFHELPRGRVHLCER
jgi:hypothetical protein